MCVGDVCHLDLEIIKLLESLGLDAVEVGMAYPVEKTPVCVVVKVCH